MAASDRVSAARQRGLGDVSIGMPQLEVIRNLAVVSMVIVPALALWLPRSAHG
jgi:hypothetical protein